MQASIKLEEMWGQIEPGVSQIFRSQELDISSAQWMSYYTMIYQYCTQPSPLAPKSHGANITGREVYNLLSEFLEKYMAELLVEMQPIEDDGDTLLSTFGKKWKTYTKMSQMINRLFNYLNRFFVAREQQEGVSEVYQIYTLCVVKWREFLFMPLQRKLTRGLLELIKRDREGQGIDTSLVSDVIDCYFLLGEGLADGKTTTYQNRSVSLKIYQDYFEQEFLDETETFYELESQAFLAANSVTEYIKKVEKRLEEEERRVQILLHGHSSERLMPLCEKVLIVKRMHLLHAEFRTLLDDDRQEDLGGMYRLLHRTNEEGLRPMRDLLEEHFSNDGLNAIKEAQESITGKNGQVDPQQYVEVILTKHAKFKALVETAFQNDAAFVAAMDKACRRFVNTNAITVEAKTTQRSPELVAKYCDSLLKKSAKGRDENEVEETLTNIMIVFKYIEDKDVFQKFYSKFLARRLVNELSASDQMEAEMISQLKTACGCEYTNKLQRMIQDVTVSKDMDGDFKSALRERDAKLPVKEFNVLVLTMGFWPFTKDPSSFNVPQELEGPLEQFRTFYGERHSGRKMAWLFQHTRGELLTSYLKSRITFQASAYQIGVLLLFNNATTHTYADIKAVTNLEDDHLKNVLRTLVKPKILTSSADEDVEVSATTEFSLNMGFKSTKIKVNIIRTSDSVRKQDDADTSKDIEDDRRMVIQAAIVRIMKSRKTLNHNQLMQEVIEILKARFRPSIPSIKMAIDTLIDKEYITRTDDRSAYTYLA